MSRGVEPSRQLFQTVAETLSTRLAAAQLQSCHVFGKAQRAVQQHGRGFTHRPHHRLTARGTACLEELLKHAASAKNRPGKVAPSMNSLKSQIVSALVGLYPRRFGNRFSRCPYCSYRLLTSLDGLVAWLPADRPVSIASKRDLRTVDPVLRKPTSEALLLTTWVTFGKQGRVIHRERRSASVCKGSIQASCSATSSKALA